MRDLFLNYAGEPLYIQLYMYYRDRITDGTLKYGDKIPSIRKCSAEFNVSKMTVESAYMQLAAEGYVYTVSQSGYYVSKLSDLTRSRSEYAVSEERESRENIRFDLSGSSADSECFDFNVWQKYIKNALRCEDRLLSYGEYQGEYDLRKALSDYASGQRGVVCRPSKVVIGAGVQNLLQLLCALDTVHSSVIFCGQSFAQGEQVFKDCGYKIFRGIDEYDGKTPISFIYVSPSHYSGQNDVMSISKRIDLLNFANEYDSIVIEDDFDSEFCYFSRPVPSLQGLDGGERVVYIGTMSRLLLPSIRISFMVLPEKLAAEYNEKGMLYNQTASKTEQIALARYITDARLTGQIRKARKLYESKTEKMKAAIEQEIKPISINVSDSGFMIYFDIKKSVAPEAIKELLRKNGIVLKHITDLDGDILRFFVSSAGVPEGDILSAVKMLKQLLK